MLGRIKKPSPAMGVALIALFVALSGTATAVTVATVPLAKRALVADNSKMLGGQSAKSLLAKASQASQQTAQQQAQSPGPASTAAGLVTIKSTPWSLGPNQDADVTVTCDSGQRAIAGGFEDPGGWSHPWDDRPSADGASWKTFVHLSSEAPGQQSGTIYAVCLK